MDRHLRTHFDTPEAVRPRKSKPVNVDEDVAAGNGIEIAEPNAGHLYYFGDVVPTRPPKRARKE